MSENDYQFIGIPWKEFGRSRNGCDCAGVVLLWMQEQMGITLPDTPKFEGQDDRDAMSRAMLGGDIARKAPKEWNRGDVLFFQTRAGKISHVAVCLGGDRLLHIVNGGTSHIVNGLTLLRRVGLEYAGHLHATDPRLSEVLNRPGIGTIDPVTAIIGLFVVGILLSAASALLAPNARKNRNQNGRYADDGLITEASPKLPLPTILGRMNVAGNSPYTSFVDKSQTVTDETLMKFNKVVVIGHAPVEQWEYHQALQINATNWADTYWHDGTNIDGMVVNPTQDKDNAVTGTIAGDSNVPSITLYDGAHAISVPVDIRAHYDRSFPVYGFNGCAYAVIRAINRQKFQQINLTARVKGVKCRTFTSAGFDVETVSAESLTGADGSKVRFKLAFDDIISVTSVEVNSTAYSAMSASAQTGNVYHLNRTKGYIEFLNAPAASATIEVDYTYHPREWSQNPATLIAHVFTEKGFGMGYDADRLNWTTFADARDYFDEPVFWEGREVPRYTADYVMDYRRPMQEHMEALKAACQSFLFPSQGRFVLIPRRADTASVVSFNTANILAPDNDSDEPDSTVQVSFPDRSQRANRLKVFFQNEEAFNAEDEAVADNERDQALRLDRLGNEGVIEESVKLEAVTSYQQAKRIAENLVAVQIGSASTIKLRTNLKGIPLMPGDIVDITHPVMPGWSARKFWVDDLELDMEGRLQLICSEVATAY